MLQHFGIAGENILHVEGLQEARADDDRLCFAEHAHLVFQSTEVDARLATYRGVDHCEQRCRNVDEGNAPLEGACRKAAEVGHHAASQAHH